MSLRAGASRAPVTSRPRSDVATERRRLPLAGRPHEPGIEPFSRYGRVRRSGPRRTPADSRRTVTSAAARWAKSFQRRLAAWRRVGDGDGRSKERVGGGIEKAEDRVGPFRQQILGQHVGGKGLISTCAALSE
jgi:hypothetical protein